MKKILMMFSFVFALSVSINAQVAQLTSIYPKYNGGSRPLEGKEYEYTIGMTGGTADNSISIKCTNGIITNSNSTVFNHIGRSSFSIKIKWGAAGQGEIYAQDGGGYRTTYPVNIEKPNVSISGPSTLKYNESANYSLSFNPNMTINSISWGNSADLQYVSGQGTGTYKIKVIRNDSKTIDNAINANVKTDFGDFSVKKALTIQPVLTITSAKTIVCAGENVTYSITSISGATIKWEALSNATLVSGQGIATATFKASGNGYGKVKATVTNGGKSYTVENSSVWVGKPSVQILPPSSSGWYEQNSSYIFSAKIDGANTSNTVWKVTGDAKPINQYGKIMTGYTGKKEGVFNITCTTSNVCGTTNSITYTGRNNPTSGTGIPGEGIGLD